MKRALIVVIAAALVANRLEAQVITRTTTVPLIDKIITVAPVAITTPALKFTGYRFTPKTLATPKLVFTGWRWTAVSFTPNPIVFTGTRKTRRIGDLR